MSVGRGPWQQMQAPPTTGHEQAGGPILTKISDVDGGNRHNGEAVGHNLAICSRRPCSVSAPLLAVRLLARRTLADGCAYSVVASGPFGDLEAIKKKREGRERGGKGREQTRDGYEREVVGCPPGEEGREIYIPPTRQNTTTGNVWIYPPLPLSSAGKPRSHGWA